MPLKTPAQTTSQPSIRLRRPTIQALHEPSLPRPSQQASLSATTPLIIKSVRSSLMAIQRVSTVSSPLLHTDLSLQTIQLTSISTSIPKTQIRSRPERRSTLQSMRAFGATTAAAAQHPTWLTFVSASTPEAATPAAVARTALHAVSVRTPRTSVNIALLWMDPFLVLLVTISSPRAFTLSRPMRRARSTLTVTAALSTSPFVTHLTPTSSSSESPRALWTLALPRLNRKVSAPLASLSVF